MNILTAKIADTIFSTQSRAQNTHFAGEITVVLKVSVRETGWKNGACYFSDQYIVINDVASYSHMVWHGTPINGSQDIT
jgi:hypothetical protein